MGFPGCSAPLHFTECRVPHHLKTVGSACLEMTMLYHLSLSFKNYICPSCPDFFMAPSHTCSFIILLLWNWCIVDLQSFASFKYTANWFNYICSYMLLLLFSCYVGLVANLWTVACQAPLSMQFPKQEYWSGLIEGMFLTEGLYPCLLLDRQILYLWTAWEPIYISQLFSFIDYCKILSIVPCAIQ